MAPCISALPGWPPATGILPRPQLHELAASKAADFTAFDLVGPQTRDGALECPKERTRVQCVLDPTTGELAPSEPVLVWQERCWSASPADDDTYDQLTRDAEWVSSAVGLASFGDQRFLAGRTEEPKWWLGRLLSLGGGVEMSCQPGVLEVTLRAGAGAKLQYTSTVVRRSWAGDDAGRSVFAEVETLNDTEGMD